MVKTCIIWVYMQNMSRVRVQGLKRTKYIQVVWLVTPEMVALAGP